jgi:hypothetical protein
MNNDDIPEDVRETARWHARLWLHSYGIHTEPYTSKGIDHPAMDTLPEGFARAILAERAAEREACATVAQNFNAAGGPIASAIRSRP